MTYSEFVLWVRGAAKSVTIRVNAFLGLVILFQNEIVLGMQTHLPDFAEYISPGSYKMIGITLVLFNLYQRTRTAMSLKEKGQM